MLLKIYELIKKIEGEIGNGAEVRFETRENVFVIRVDWWNDDFHSMRQFSEIELAKIVDDSILVNHFIAEAKHNYSRKPKAG